MSSKTQKQGAVSLQAIRRLPSYYHYLKTLQQQGVETISAPVIAREMDLNEVQVRKDLASVSQQPGRPRTGFRVEDLLRSIGVYLGYHNRNDAILVGAGQLGRALLAHQGFEENGVRIVAAFDSDPTLVGLSFGGKQVFEPEKLRALCKRLRVHIGIITVPAAAAQPVCDLLVAGGVLAVWNFAPVHLKVPQGVLVQNENMAVSLALLSQHLAERQAPGGGKA